MCDNVNVFIYVATAFHVPKLNTGMILNCHFAQAVVVNVLSVPFMCLISLLDNLVEQIRVCDVFLCSIFAWLL